MFGLNKNQLIAIGIGSCSLLGGSSTQLTTLLGSIGANYVIALCALIAGVLSVILTVTTGQGSTLKQVLDMPGVEHIDVNAKANSTVATFAMDPKQDKISPTPAAMQQVTATAKGG